MNSEISLFMTSKHNYAKGMALMQPEADLPLGKIWQVPWALSWQGPIKIPHELVTKTVFFYFSLSMTLRALKNVLY